MMLSVIIPTYNEKDNVRPLVDGLEKALSGLEHEIIIVDDNSPDGTAGVVAELAEGNPRLRLVRRAGKQGLAGAIVAGAKAARGDRLLVMDADLSHPPEKAPALASMLASADLAVGSRLMKGGGVETWPLHRKLISAGATLLAHLVIHGGCSDPMSGFFAVKKDIFMRTRFRVKGYKILLNILADNPRCHVAEIPYIFRDRHAGQTKLGAGEIVNYVADLLRLRLG